MKEIEVEVLEAFYYSPNGWDNARAIIGQEITLPSNVAEGLLSDIPPKVAILNNTKPIVFSNDEEFIEKKLGIDVEETFDIPEGGLEIELGIEEQPVIENEENEEIDDFLEEVECDLLDEEDCIKALYSLDELEKMVSNSAKGADEIDMGSYFKAIQKSGAWYNIVKKGHEDTILNESGIGKSKLAGFVYKLYLKEA